MPPLSYVQLRFHFAPNAPGNYYQQAMCLIKNQDALLLELCGSAFDLLSKPVLVERILEKELQHHVGTLKGSATR